MLAFAGWIPELIVVPPAVLAVGPIHWIRALALGLAKWTPTIGLSALR